MSRKPEKYNFNFHVTEGCLELNIQVEGFTPSRPAPPCSNPDDPRYSDDGDNAEWESVAVYLSGVDISMLLPPSYISEHRDEIIERGEERSGC